MKYTIIIMLVLILASCGGGGSSSTTYSEVCATCNGYGVIVDQATGYKRVCPACGNPCTACGGFGLATDYYGNLGNCVYCSGTGRNQNKSGNGSNVSFGARTTKFVKTNAKCDECSCSGYWGIKHDSGAYEGDCQNTDQWGHRCGHSPSHHGLKQY